MIVGAVFLLISSALSIIAGRLNYNNYWGGVVFAPFAFVIGALMLIIVLRSEKKRSVPTSELLKSPLEDYKKW